MPSPQPTELRPLMLAGNIGWQIAIPLVVLALLGRYLDTVFGTSPLLFLIGIILAIISSSWLVVRTITRVIDASSSPNPTISDDTP